MTENSINDATTMRPGGTGDVLGRIDQYELVKELGGGGFGTVFLAKDTVAGIEVAVKGLPPLVKNNREELENIRANFALVSRLTHTNIAKALVLHPAKDVSYSSEDVRQKLRVLPGDTLMVMEYAPGVTLSQWRKRFPTGNVPFGEAISIVRQIACALDYAHGRKILHRDIKPANIMVETKADEVPMVRVLDFGLAAEIRSSMGRVSREIHDTSGTRPYMAPEQWDGARQGPATDQYSLAVLFHELVTGAVPFESVFTAGEPVAMLYAAVHKPFKAPASLPMTVRRALEKALSKKPEERFANCGEFVDALEGKAKISRSGSVRRGSGGVWSSLLAFVLLAVLGGGGALWWAVKRDPTSSHPVPPPVVDESDIVEIRAQAYVQKELVKRIDDSDGFRTHKDSLADELTKADAYGEAKKWDMAAASYTNYVDACKELSKLDDERRGAVSDRAKAESARQKAKDAGAEQYASDSWQSATRLFEEGQKLMSQKRFSDAKQKFDSAADLFSQSAKEAKGNPGQKPPPPTTQPPTLTVVAVLDGREVSGAQMSIWGNKVTLPYKWDTNAGRLVSGRSFGPYLVEYSEGKKQYYGSFKLTVDWHGHVRKPVNLTTEWPKDIQPPPRGIVSPGF